MLRGLAFEIGELKEISQPSSRRPKLRRIEYPRVFSFIENPEETIRALDHTVRVILSRPRRMEFDQSKCVDVDLCAASVLNALVRDARRKQSIRCAGVLAEDAEANEILRATGLPKELAVQGVNTVPRGFSNFALTQGRARTSSEAMRSDKGLLSTRLTQYVDQCLKQFGSRLTDNGRQHIAELTAEVIDNAERHSGKVRWWIAGYLRRKPNDELGDCHIVIFNVGDSIAQSLRKLPSNASLRGDIEALVAKHRKGGIFGFGPKWQEDDLWTLYALQQGVSARNVQPPGSPIGDNGQGTIRMIQWFQELGKRADGAESPKMAVVSGATYILFDGQYSIRNQVVGNGRIRKVITFNDQNSLEYPPDERCVRSLDESFPGTMISLRFFLDRPHLIGLQQENADNKRD